MTPSRIRQRVGWDIARQMVTPAKVRKAIWFFEPYKAPELDYLIRRLLLATDAGVEGLGHISKYWLKIKMIFTPKPDKMSYTEVEDFRSISLTSSLLKTLERLVDQ